MHDGGSDAGLPAPESRATPKPETKDETIASATSHVAPESEPARLELVLG
jgi:hypothetical protein